MTIQPIIPESWVYDPDHQSDFCKWPYNAVLCCSRLSSWTLPKATEGPRQVLEASCKFENSRNIHHCFRKLPALCLNCVLKALASFHSNEINFFHRTLGYSKLDFNANLCGQEKKNTTSIAVTYCTIRWEELCRDQDYWSNAFKVQLCQTLIYCRW